MHNLYTVFSLIIAQFSKSSTDFNSSTVHGMCERINAQSPVVAHASIRLHKHVLVPV